MSKPAVRLTQHASCAGCAAKMGPEALAQLLPPLAGIFDPGRYPNLLAGLAPPDDAAVWKLDHDRAIVFTADFFPPVVDDPVEFGAIAAANSMSDVYAMGGEPILALNLAGFPDELDHSILADILRGGAEKVREAGAVVAGGHTTVESEPRYGLAVVGLVRPDAIWPKGGARPGDVLFLTKPLGTGMVTTALKRGVVDAGHLEGAVASMTRLSAAAARILRSFGPQVHAVTDVTGFSLAGHGREVALRSEVALRFSWDALPWLAGAAAYARDGLVTGGGRRNREHYGPHVRDTGRRLADWEHNLLYDPQTSGPLLAAVDAGLADTLASTFREAGQPLWRVGDVRAAPAGTLEIV